MAENSAMMKVGFIGIGHMGAGMAANLLRAGHDVTVYNRTPGKAQGLIDSGAHLASRVADACRGSAVITMLADDDAVEGVVFGEGGLLRRLGGRSIHVSMSTISVALSERIAVSHAGAGQRFVAAPVFGRPDVAAAGNLFIVAAGQPDAVSACMPLFEAMGQKTFHVGEGAPAANVIKLAGNFLISTVIESLAEAFSLIRKFGLDPNLFLDVLTNSLFNAPVYRNYGSMIAADRFEPAGFRLPLGLKDNRLLLAAAEGASVPMPMASIVHDRFVAALAHGLNEADWAGIARISYRDAGL
jgi:3-hydroxyisobutyrate dehydrogenase-like beta-hydroxyacid dehydrogenase